MSNLIYSPYINAENTYHSKKMPITAFITLSAAMVAGTGGGFAANNICPQSTFGAKPFIRFVDSGRSPRGEISSHIALITRVRAAFGMNYTQLAYTLNVSRQTVYDWIKGSQPRAEALTRLWNMEALGLNLQEVSAPRKRSLLLRPVIEDKNLLTLLREDGDAASAIQSLLGNSLMDNSDPKSTAAPSRLKKVRRVSIEDVSRVFS